MTQASTAKEPVLALEYLVTATPEQINSPDFDRKAYFKAAKAYLDKLLGAENFIHEAVHCDERSVHGHFIYDHRSEARHQTASVVVGKTEDGNQKREVLVTKTKAGRTLNAKKFTGRDASIELQTTFAEQVGAPFGLRREYRWQQGQAHRDQGVLRPAPAGAGGDTDQDGSPRRAGSGAG